MDETRPNPLLWEKKHSRVAIEQLLELIEQVNGLGSFNNRELKSTLTKNIYRSRGKYRSTNEESMDTHSKFVPLQVTSIGRNFYCTTHQKRASYR